jgi:hypothetical protein
VPDTPTRDGSIITGSAASLLYQRLTIESCIMTCKKINWKTCKHDFPNEHETVREEMFGVAFGSKRVCKLCGAIEYEDWTETRSCGGIPRIYPPEGQSR